MSKGVARTDGGAVSGRLEIDAGPLYGGAFAVTDNTLGADAEVQVYGGTKFTVLGAAIDLRGSYKTLRGAAQGQENSEFEARAQAARYFGPVVAKVSVDYTPDNYGAAIKQAVYAEGNLGYGIAKGSFASVGYGIRRTEGGFDYNAWNVGLTQALTDKLALDVRYYDTDKSDVDKRHAGRAVVGLTARF
jgi:hypothetical protein